MAILSRQKQPNTRRPDLSQGLQTHIILHKKFMARPSFFQRKAAQGAFFQGAADLVKRQSPFNQRRWPCYEGRRPLFKAARFISADFVCKQVQRPFIKARPNGRFIKAEAAEWANIHILAADSGSSLSRAINASAAEPSHVFSKLQFYQCQAQWPFHQSRSNQMARPLDFSHKLQFRYYPAQSIYQRPGKAIFSQSQPNGRCITWPLYQGRSS